MDQLQRTISVDRFRLAFHTQKGTVFQDWFGRYAFCPDLGKSALTATMVT